MYPRFTKSFLFFLLFGIISISSRAQSIFFNYNDGSHAAYNLEDVRKITFAADLMNLHLWDGSVYGWNVSTIGYYQYNETSLNVQEWLNNANAWEVTIFPNPTSEILDVRFNLPKMDEISIELYDTQGKLILVKKIGKMLPGEHVEMLNLYNLPQGAYYCRINGLQNAISKKVVKQ